MHSPVCATNPAPTETTTADNNGSMKRAGRASRKRLAMWSARGIRVIMRNTGRAAMTIPMRRSAIIPMTKASSSTLMVTKALVRPRNVLTKTDSAKFCMSRVSAPKGSSGFRYADFVVWSSVVPIIWPNMYRILSCGSQTIWGFVSAGPRRYGDSSYLCVISACDHSAGQGESGSNE